VKDYLGEGGVTTGREKPNVRVNETLLRWPQGQEEGEPEVAGTQDRVVPWDEAVRMIQNSVYVGPNKDLEGYTEARPASVTGPLEQVRYHIKGFEGEANSNPVFPVLLLTEAKSPRMSPQNPVVQVPIYDNTVYRAKAPIGPISSATLRMHEATFHFYDIGAKPDAPNDAKVVIDLGKLAPHPRIHAEETLTQATPQAIMEAALKIRQNCKEYQAGRSVPAQDSPLAALVDACGDGKVASLQVIKKDDPMVFTFDRTKPGAGHVVRLDGLYDGLPLGSHAVLGGVKGEDEDDYLATFGASTHISATCFSSSGGPAPFLPVSELEFTGETRQQTFWRWRDGFPHADNSEEVTLEVPVWSWKGRDKGTLGLSREVLQTALDRMESRVPRDSRNCAYLELPWNQDGSPTAHGRGFITDPSDWPTKRPYFHAQMTLGSSEFFAYGVGRTREACLADLKASALETFDSLVGKGPRDPERLKQSQIASHISVHTNDTSITSAWAEKRFAAQEGAQDEQSLQGHS
jgi:hypothetical protein